MLVVANNECGHTRMCGSEATKIEIQGNVAAGKIGTLTDPDSIHLSIGIENGYSGITVLDGQPGSSDFSDVLGMPTYGVYCILCLNASASRVPKSAVVWGPIKLPNPGGMTSEMYARTLLLSAEGYSNGMVEYSFPTGPSANMAFGEFNSNSWAAGLLLNSGGVVPNLDFSPCIAPGYQNPVPHPYFRQ